MVYYVLYKRTCGHFEINQALNQRDEDYKHTRRTVRGSKQNSPQSSSLLFKKALSRPLS